MKKIRITVLMLMACFLVGCTTNIKDGAAFLEEEKYEEAIACFEKDITEKKNLGEAYRGIAIAQYELGEYHDAIASFQHALSNKAEETATIYGLMAACYLQVDENEMALDYYEKALEMDDCTEELEQEILYNEIAIYQEMGDWETVKEKATAYKEAYPDDTRMDKTIEFLETR